jgi:predicted thioesterase
MAISVGMKNELRLKTGPEHTAQKFFPQVPDVFGTPFLGGLFEGVSAGLMAPHLAPGEQSVGISMNLKHTAPTPLGMEVRASPRSPRWMGAKSPSRWRGLTKKKRLARPFMSGL